MRQVQIICEGEKENVRMFSSFPSGYGPFGGGEDKKKMMSAWKAKGSTGEGLGFGPLCESFFRHQCSQRAFFTISIHKAIIRVQRRG